MLINVKKNLIEVLGSLDNVELEEEEEALELALENNKGTE